MKHSKQYRESGRRHSQKDNWEPGHLWPFNNHGKSTGFYCKWKRKLLKYFNESNMVLMTFWKNFSGCCHGKKAINGNEWKLGDDWSGD